MITFLKPITGLKKKIRQNKSKTNGELKSLEPKHTSLLSEQGRDV